MSTPKRFIILRGVENNSTVKLPMAEQPKQVWTILDEPAYNEKGLLHGSTGFIEDRMHDWDWSKGFFRFYGHSGRKFDKHDLVVIYEVR